MGPSGKAPTVAEKAWRRAIIEFGCVACYLDGHAGTPAVQHHIVEANRRVGHRFSLPLCDPGHHQPDTRSGKVALHPGRNPAFIALYGTERELLARLERRLGFEAAT